MANFPLKTVKKRKNGSVSVFIIIFLIAVLAFIAGFVFALSQSSFSEQGDEAIPKKIKTRNTPAKHTEKKLANADKMADSHKTLYSEEKLTIYNYKEKMPEHNTSRVKEKKDEKPQKEGAKIAIIIDDFGNNLNNVDDYCSLDIPITFAILPRLPFSGRISEKARQAGKEVILHLPLENTAGINPGPGTITTGMSTDEIALEFEKNLNSVPGAVGFNNHEGSKATEDEVLMDELMKNAGRHGLYFIDSRTSPKSLGRTASKRYRIPFIQRRIFLDNEDDIAYIRAQVTELVYAALEEGEAVGIGHCRKNTYLVLKEMIPQIRKEGIQFVFASELAK